MKNVPIPTRMACLPRDPRGYPIPFTVAVREGRAHFTVNEEHLRQQCLRENLCPICGQKLWRLRWLVGGPLSAFDPQGAYLDPPMHDECAHYALQVCPYLAAPRYSKLINGAKMPEDERQYLLADDNVVSRKARFFCRRRQHRAKIHLRPDQQWPRQTGAHHSLYQAETALQSR